MGCDIHIVPEVYTKETHAGFYGDSDEEPSWKAAIPHIEVERASGETKLTEPRGLRLDNFRNYTVFSVLADVRNGRGFAGVDTGDRIEPIDEPRGLPEDASDIAKRRRGDWGVDGHSVSWLTLEEIKGYDWDQEIVKRGFVDAATYVTLMENGYPMGPVSGGVSGQRITKVSNEKMEELIEAHRDEAHFEDLLVENEDGELETAYNLSVGMLEQKSEEEIVPEALQGVHTKAEWTVPLSRYCSFFLNKHVKVMEWMASSWRVDDDEFRLVFWFDN